MSISNLLSTWIYTSISQTISNKRSLESNATITTSNISIRERQLSLGAGSGGYESLPTDMVQFGSKYAKLTFSKPAGNKHALN